MTLNIPDLQEIYTRNITDYIISYNQGKPNEEKIDPSIKNNPEGALVYTQSQQFNAIYKMISFAIKQLFVDTAEGVYLERLATGEGVVRNVDTTATGFITITGTPSTVIPINTILNRESIQYETLTEVSISNLIFSVSSITRVGQTVTVTLSSIHGLSPGMEFTISGANESEYNGTFNVESVSSEYIFTYIVSGTPATPATGTIEMDYDGAFVEVESLTKGSNTNAVGGSSLILATPIAGVDDTSFVQFSQLGGGTDVESDESFRARVIFKKQNPNTAFNTPSIITKAKEVSGVTRVWVFEITPSIGQVTIYFTRDLDDNPIPTSGEVQDVKDSILSIKYAVTSDNDVIVSAPTPINVNITFSSLSPNTQSMQEAISNNLYDFFRSTPNVSQNLLLTQINSIIYNTIDDEGNRPLFTLSSPSGDITVGTGELPIGTITF
jgi:uncharacterized phage protein gp47/JayE